MRHTHSDPIRDFEIGRRAEGIVALAFAQDTRLTDDPAGELRRRGFGTLATEMRQKAAVLPMDSGDTAVIGTAERVALVEQVDRQSAILSLAGVQMVPLFTQDAARVLGEIAAFEVTEGAAKPVSRLDLAGAGEPRKAAALIVFSQEWARATNMQPALTRAIVSAVAARVDAILIDALTGGTPGTSTDIGALLAALSGGNPSQPAILGSYTELLAQPEAVRAARDLGVQIVATSAAGDVVVALDLAGIVIGASDVAVETARHASLALTDDGAGTPTYNLWHRNSVGLRGERMVTIAMRPDAVAFATGGSPA